MDRTAIWVQTHAIRPERNHGSSSHSRSTSRHNHGLSGSGFVSQHSSQTDLDSEQHPAMSSPTRSRHRYSSRAESPEHTRSKHHHSSRQHDDYGSQRKEYHDERSNSVRQRRAPCINIPDEAYRNPNLPAFVQGPPGSGYPMNMSSIRTVLPPSPTAAKAIQGPPSPPLKFPAQLNPKKSRPTSEKRRPSLNGVTFEPPVGLVDEYRDRERDREKRSSGEPRRLRKRAVSDVRV